LALLSFARATDAAPAMPKAIAVESAIKVVFTVMANLLTLWAGAGSAFVGKIPNAVELSRVGTA
jgi:hypothetical protein